MSTFQRVTIASAETGPDAPVSEQVDSTPDTSVPAVEPTEVPNADSSSSDQGSQPEVPQRPDWLPEKFKTPEDFKKSYEELEKKLGSKPKEEAKPEAKAEGEVKEEVKEGEENSLPDVSKVDLNPFHQEWAEKGELTPESFDKLEKMGFPRGVVEQYIAGVQATQERETQAVYKEVGGEDSYKAMIEWAGQSLSADEIKAYDDLVSAGNATTAKIAAKGLYAQYIAANGKAPKLVGGTPSGTSNITPFRSTAEVVRAMSDPRYKNDSAFRRDVERRLEASSVL